MVGVPHAGKETKMKTGIFCGAVVIAFTLLAGISLYMALHPFQNVSNNANIVKPLPPRTQAVVQISKVKVTATDKKQTRIVNIPKFGEIIVKVTDKGEVVLASTGTWLGLGMRPHLGIAYTGRVEPMIGLQWVRLEKLNLGTSVVLTPSFIGASLDKDVTENSQIGLGIGVSSEMTNKYIIYYSLAF